MSARLSKGDITILSEVIRSGVQPPTFHKHGFSLDRRSSLVLAVLDRHGIDVTFDSTNGELSLGGEKIA